MSRSTLPNEDFLLPTELVIRIMDMKKSYYNQALTIVSLVLLLFGRTALAQDPKKAARGERIYDTYCQTCHGDALVSSGQTFDLRRLRKDERPRFENAVQNGKGQMPPWKGVVSAEEMDLIWHYIRTLANDRDQ
jgi:mono/diheme cytochrome c family protein